MMDKKKTVHLKEDLHKLVDLYKVERDLSSMEKAVDQLIRSGLKYEDLPDYLIEKLEELESERGTVKEREIKESGKEVKEDIQLSDLSKDLIDLTGELKGGKTGSKETVREITLANLRYLKAKGEGSKSDFIKNVYPEFEEDHTKGSYWKESRLGFKQLSELTDKLKTPSKGHTKYIWKGD